MVLDAGPAVLTQEELVVAHFRHAAILPGISREAVLTLLAHGALATLAEAGVIATGV